MKENIVSAVFDSRMQAEQCITQLRMQGVPDDAISLVAQHEGEVTTTHPDGSDDTDHADNKASGMTKGALTGAGVGALFGLAAFLIPGVGPFITAGALATTLGYAGGAAVSGAVVGATAGGLAGLMMDYGIAKEDAELYQERVGQGGVVVIVDGDKAGGNIEKVRQIMQTAGGRGSAYMA